MLFTDLRVDTPVLGGNVKVALCSDWYPGTGGVTSHMACLAEELQRLGNDVTIITKKDHGKTTRRALPKVKIIEIPLLSGNVLAPPNLIKLERVLREGRFDVVHGHHAFTPTSLLSVSLAKRLGIPTVLTNHSISFGYDSRIWTPFSYLLFPYRVYINKADRVIAVSRAAADFIEHFADKRKITVIPNMVGETFFDGDPGEKTSEKKNRPTILYVGRLSHRKGLHTLIIAMRRVVKKIPEARMLIVGDGLMREFIKLLIKAFGLEENVKLLGSVPERQLKLFYKMSDVFVLPSVYGESFGIVLLEAMASGVPVVATDTGGIRDVVKDNCTGLLVERENSEGLAKAMLKVLKDPKLAEKLVRNAKREAMKYRSGVIARKIESVYEELALAKRSKHNPGIKSFANLRASTKWGGTRR